MTTRFAFLVTTILALLLYGCLPRESINSQSSGNSSDQATFTATKIEGKQMRLSVYILFDGNCKQAMEFYKSALGGDLELTTVGESPMKDAFPEPMHSKVVNARLKSTFADISATDWLRPDQTRVNGNTVCLYISGGGLEETTALFRKLSEGADVTDPISEQPFGLYGALNDKFGIRWMFHAVKE